MKPVNCFKILSLFSAALVVLIASFPARAQQQSAKEAIAAMNKEFEQAHLKGDAHTLAMQYTKDAISFREGKKTVKGRSDIEKMWKEDVGEGGKRAIVKTVEVREAGDWAYENGEFKALDKDGSIEYGGNYLLIWKREDGQWKIHREIGTSDPSLKGNGLRSAIEAAEQKMVFVFNKQDAVAMAAMYAADAESLPPDSKPLKGRKEIEAFWKKELSPEVTQKARTLEVIDLGDFAHEHGTYTLTDKSGNTVEEGKYMVMWKREEGQWKVYREMWNTKAAEKKQ